ncbi:Putative transposase [Shewanella benthica KT99]|uniref:Putative transposase n=1 Tax=Shewanella benthica KT99 TaxID=314608 RepID=A9D127_9GAMM|nr:Putative transposase [Shewanella benthica KT99]
MLMTATFLKHFDSIADPRIERCKKHNLLDIILLAISAVMSGSEGWEDIENFGHLKLDWLLQHRPFKAGIPRHDTIARVICRLKADEKEIAKLIVKQKADYILALKGHHSGLQGELKQDVVSKCWLIKVG